MLQKGFLKPRLSIDVIGKFNFWQGIFFGFAASIILNLFLNFSRELFRFFSRLNELVIYSDSEYLYADLFYAIFSALFGFGVCLHFWFDRDVRGHVKRYRHDFSKASIHLFLILPLLAISRMGTVILLPLVNLRGYECHLNLHLEFPILFLLLACVVFLVFWQGIRLNFRVGYWFPKTFIAVLSWGFILFTFLRLDRDVVDRTDKVANALRYETIRAEVELAKQRGIHLSDSTILVLGKFATESKVAMNRAISIAFQKGHPVSSDTLVLQKVMLKNLDHRFLAPVFENGAFSRERLWTYAFPEQIEFQISLRDTQDLETLVLFEILAEMIDIANIENGKIKDSPIQYDKLEYGILDFEKTYLMASVPNLDRSLSEVVARILIDDKYSRFHHLIAGFDLPDPAAQKIPFE